MAGARRVIPLVLFVSVFFVMSIVYVYHGLSPATQEFLRYLVLVLYYGAASVVFLSLLGYGAVLFRRSTRIGGETSPIEEARETDDVVEVEGVAREMEEALESEFSEREVLVHEWEKRRKKIRGEDPTLESGREAVPFYVEDGTGRVAVDAGDADLRLGEEAVNDDEVFRHVEGRIEPGDEVRVRGSKRSLSSDGGYAAEGDADEQATVYIGGGKDTSLRVSDGVEKRKAKRLRLRACLAALLGVFLMAGSVAPPNFGLF